MNKKFVTYGLYDFSNSGYVLVFQSFLFPIFLNSILESTSLSTGIWGTAVSISVLIAILLSPIIGSIGDRTNKMRIFAILVTFSGLGATLAPLFFANSGMNLVISFVFFNSLFQVTLSLYDSFLKDFSHDPKDEVRLSTFAWGFGYLGGILFLIIVLILQKIGLPDSLILSISGFLYFVLSIYALIKFKNYLKTSNTENFRINLATKIKSKLVNFKKKMILPLITYWLIADCVAAIIFFSGLYSRTELGISMKTIGGLMLGVQLIAFFTTSHSGNLACKYGVRRLIYWCLVIWMFVLLGLFFSSNVYHLAVVMLLTALVIGSTQALMRAHFAETVRNETSGESFGYFSVATKSAAIIAPVSIGWLSEFFGSMRFTFLFMVIPIILSIFLWNHISVTKKK